MGRFISNNGKYQTGKKAAAAVKTKKPRKGGRVALIIILVVLILGGAVGAAGAFGVRYYNSLLDQVRRAEYVENELTDEELAAILGYVPETIDPAETTEATEEVTEPTDPDYGETGKIVNIMIVGQNMRWGEDNKLSDTMILATLNKETKTLTLTSFLRDLYVKLPNYKNHVCGSNRMNVAYNLGWKWGGDAGAFEMINNCVENNFGAKVDYNIEIDFDGFSLLMDLIGGVDVEMTEAEAAYMCKLHGFSEGDFKEGKNHLDGYGALCYARMRKSSPEDNDIRRSARQRYLIGEIIRKLTRMNLTELNEIVTSALPFVLTNMSNEVITELAFQCLPMLPELQVVSNQVPAEGTAWGEVINIAGYDSGVMKCDMNKNRQLLTAITEEPVEEVPAG